MGCGNSSNLPPVETVEADIGKGGSTIMFSGMGEERKDQATEAEVTKGGSMIMMDRRIGADGDTNWQPGDGVQQPLPPHKEVAMTIGSEEKPIVSLTYGYFSEQGYSTGANKPNQDSSLVQASLGGLKHRALFAVFDGHGPYGEVASHFCRSRMAQAVSSHEAYNTNPALALTSAFVDVHNEFCGPTTVDAGVNPTVSGTTAVAALLDGRTMHVANAGDSRALLLRRRGADLVAHPVSDDHKPARADERARLASTSATVFQESQLRSGGDREKWYVCRVDKGRILYGVLFSRSIGDKDATDHMGIIAEPELQTIKLEEGDAFLVLATDGVWDVMTNDDVATFLARETSAQSAALKLVNECVSRWSPNGDTTARRDDITAVVVALQSMTSASASASTRSNYEGDADAAQVDVELDDTALRLGVAPGDVEATRAATIEEADAEAEAEAEADDTVAAE